MGPLIFQNPFVIAIFGGLVMVILFWGYSLFQRASLESVRLARNGETSEEDELNNYIYSSPPLIACFTLGSVVSYIVWFLLRRSPGFVTSAGGAANVFMPGAQVGGQGATETAIENAAAVFEPISNLMDSVKRAVTSSGPILKTGMATF